MIVPQFLVALLLFTQFAVVAQACELPVNSPAAAFGEKCHDFDIGNANACLAHCLQDDQALDTQHHAGFVSAPASFIAVAFYWFDKPLAGNPPPLRNGGPPASILFCSFRT
ncbi:MAG: hypothetical protein ACREV0_07830 [Burkholderiales bacterium]